MLSLPQSVHQFPLSWSSNLQGQAHTDSLNKLRQLVQSPSLSSTEKHGIMIEIISLNPIYSEPCRHAQHLYSTRTTYLNPNVLSNEDFYMFPSSYLRNINCLLSISSDQVKILALRGVSACDHNCPINPIYSGVMKAMLLYNHDPTKFIYQHESLIILRRVSNNSSRSLI